MNAWTRDDLPSLPEVLGDVTTQERGEGAAAYRTAALAHLNAHHPKPERTDRVDLWSVTRKAMSEVDPTRKLDTAELDALASYVADKVAGHALSRAERAERERDEALRKKGEMVDRAVRAERERDAAVARADQLRDERDDAVQSCMAVGRERDEWKARAEAAAREREEIADQFATFRAEIVAEAVKARESAVTRADIEKAVRSAFKVWGYDRVTGQEWEVLARIRPLFDRGEAEQAVDPVEEQTDALADILYGDELVTDQMRGVLERVVRAGMLFPEQEADQ